MNYLMQLQRGVDFIEERLDEDLTLAEVAKVAGISRWHYQRIFRALTGETLKGYIRSRRLARSRKRLIDGELRILDIAMLAGFESQEAYARAFKKAFDMTPSAYRKLGDNRLFLHKVRFDRDYLRHIHGNVSLEPEIYEAKSMTMVGLHTNCFGVDSDKNNIGDHLPGLWETFLSRLSEIDHVIEGTCYGVVKQEREDGERLSYHAAIAVTEAATLPAGMVRVEVPPATYARFVHRGPAKNVDHTVNYIYSTWLAQSGRRHTYGPDIEVYGAAYHPTSPDSEMAYAIPVS